MATQDPPLDEIQWRSPQTAAYMQGIHSNTVLFYFAESPFFDPMSNNAVVYKQSFFNPNMRRIIETREAFEGHLKTMSGLEYLVAQEPADAMYGTGVWVIRKQTRRLRQGQEAELTLHATYFVVGENVYMAPSFGDIMASRTLSILTSINKMFTKAASLPNFTPALGNTYMPPPSSRPGASIQSQLGQTSKEGTPLPESLHSPKKVTIPNGNGNSNAYLNNRLLEETLKITLQYGDEFMDENPVTGEPGAFHLKGTGRLEKDGSKLKVPAIAAGKGAAIGGNGKVGTPAPPPKLKTDIEPAPKKKGEKTPTKSPGGGKLKRKKSKVGLSPTTPGGRTPGK